MASQLQCGRVSLSRLRFASSLSVLVVSLPAAVGRSVHSRSFPVSSFDLTPAVWIF